MHDCEFIQENPSIKTICSQPLSKKKCCPVGAIGSWNNSFALFSPGNVFLSSLQRRSSPARLPHHIFPVNHSKQKQHTGADPAAAGAAGYAGKTHWIPSRYFPSHVCTHSSWPEHAASCPPATRVACLAARLCHSRACGTILILITAVLIEHDGCSRAENASAELSSQANKR